MKMKKTEGISFGKERIPGGEIIRKRKGGLTDERLCNAQNRLCRLG